MRLKAQNPRDTPAYYVEPYTVQHFIDWLRQTLMLVPKALWFTMRYMTSKRLRLNVARQYNQAMFGNIPTSQIYVTDGNTIRPLRDEERTWPE